MNQAEYEALVERDWRHNMAVFVAWEVVWGFGMPFAMFVTFAPAYLGALEAPKWLIGLVLALPSLSAAGQIVVSHRVPAARRLAVLRSVTAASIVPWLVYSLVASLWGDAWPRSVHWLLYAAVQALFIGGSTVVLSLYWEIMTDNIPPRRRGLLFGLRTAGFGGVGLAMGAVAAVVLATWSTPLNFRISFVIGSSCFLVSCLTLWWVRDHVNPEHSSASAEERLPFRRYLRETTRGLWNDPNYRIMVFFLVLLAVATNGAPFMVAAARDQLQATAQAQGVFSLVYLGTTAGLGWVLGLLADRHGYRLVACVCCFLVALAFLLCLTTSSLVTWYLAYGAYSISSIAVGMVLCNLSAELCPDTAPNRLVAVGNVLVVGFVLAANTLSGAVVDWTGMYMPAFIADLVLSLVALCGFLFIVREPRSGQRYMIKSLPRA